MHGEPFGGWGRSIRGAELAVTKLQKDHPHLAVQLQSHVALVHHARLLQPDRIASVTDVKLGEALDALESSEKVDFPTDTKLLLVQKKAAALTTVIAAAEPTTDVTVQVSELMSIMQPWDYSSQHGFKCKQPKLSDIGCVQQQAEVFEIVMIKQLLISLVTAGEKAAAHTKVLCERMLAAAKQVDMLKQKAKGAKLASDLREVCSGLIGILCGLTSMQEVEATIVNMQCAASKVSGDAPIIPLVSAAAMQTALYRDRIMEFGRCSKAMANVIPEQATNKEAIECNTGLMKKRQ